MTATTESETPASSTRPDYDAIVIGAGFSGLYMLYRLRKLGLSARVYEKADDVGGTWYWNRYPGARCDSESHVYCYSFSEELLTDWEWSERYPEQPEILEYLRFAADRLDLRRDIQFGTAVTRATLDEATGHWHIETDDGQCVTTGYFITAVGCLSTPYVPDFDGIDSFEGETYHTASWPHEPVDFDGLHIGVIGTGSSGIQLIPEVADMAGHVSVFQRTPNYVIPAQNRPLDQDRYAEIRANYDEILEETRSNASGHPFAAEFETAEGLSDEEIEAVLEERWNDGGFRFLRAFADLRTNPETNEVVSEFIREKIRTRVSDPELAETLVPTDHPYGAKRPPLNYNGYYRTFERQDVDLVDVETAPIEGIDPAGLRTTEQRYDLDVIIFATGFDAMTGTLLNIDIRGRDGLSLAEKWANGPRTFLGLGVHGFPNLFTITGPQSPSVLTNMPVAIEQHVEWIANCIETLVERDIQFIEPTKAAEDEWVAHTNAVAEETLFVEADSWYVGANVPGKARTFTPYPGGLDRYRRRCEEVAANDYEGFVLTGRPTSLSTPSTDG